MPIFRATSLLDWREIRQMNMRTSALLYHSAVKAPPPTHRPMPAVLTHCTYHRTRTAHAILHPLHILYCTAYWSKAPPRLGKTSDRRSASVVYHQHERRGAVVRQTVSRAAELLATLPPLV